MQNSSKRGMGLLFTILFFGGVVAWTAAGNTGNAAPIDPPKDGFSGIPESNAANFEIYVQRLPFGDLPGSETLEDKFPCQVASACGGQTSVTLRVTPSNYAPDVRWDDALGSGKGHVVAKVVVSDGVPYDRFHLRGDDVAYLWIGQVQGKRAAALYRVRAGVVQNVYQFGDIKYCKYANYQKPAVHHNTPAKCSGTGAQSAASMSSDHGLITLASNSPSNAPANGANNMAVGNGLWVSCAGGCCEVQY